MHQIVLFTALTATSGIFGGGRTATCATGTCPQAAYTVAAPVAAAPVAAPQALAYAAAPVPFAQVAQPQFALPRLGRRNRLAFFSAPATSMMGVFPRR